MVTGLPGSGKSTVGERVASTLDIPFLDKDNFLEDLFEERGIGDANWRQKLSLGSNALFQKEAETKRRVVLVSHWRPKNQGGSSGTPTEWLSGTFNRIVELYCACPLGLAARRFKMRKRHPGHLDGNRSNDQLLEWMRRYESQLPLMLGTQVTICTAEKLEIKVTVAKIRDAIQDNT